MNKIRFNNRYDLSFAGHSSASESVLADMLEAEAARKLRKPRKPRKPREAIPVRASDLDAVRLASQGEIVQEKDKDGNVTSKAWVGKHVSERRKEGRFMETSCGGVKHNNNLLTENNSR